MIDCGTWPLTAGRAATDQHASNLTVIRDTSNIQPRSVGKTRLTTRCSRTARPRPPQASYPTLASRTPPHPQLPNNVACNSPTALSMFEIRSLKSCGFREALKRPRRGIACEISELSTDFSNSSHEASRSSTINPWTSTKSYVNAMESRNYRACATQSSLLRCCQPASVTTAVGSTITPDSR